MSVPSIGRVVHVMMGGQHYAGLITEVWSDICVNVVVFAKSPYGGAVSLGGRIVFAASPVEILTSLTLADESSNRDFSWHWPEFVPPMHSGELPIRLLSALVPPSPSGDPVVTPNVDTAFVASTVEDAE